MSTATLSRLLYRREEGSSMIAVLMVMLVVFALGLASVQLARHANDASSVDRERFQSVGSAEAGINDALVRLKAGAGCDAGPTAAKQLIDNGQLVGSYQTRIDPESGTACGETFTRVIHSWGYAPTGSGRAMRHLEVTVKIVPRSFWFTLFASGTAGLIDVKNTANIDGDAYALNVDQTFNNLTAKDVISSGTIITKNNAVYSGTLWAGGDLILGNNSQVGGSIIASGTKSGTQGNVTLGNDITVGGDVQAKGSVTLPQTYTINGSITQNDPTVPLQYPAPVLQRPTFVWDSLNYAPVVPVEKTALLISSDLNAARNNLSGVYRSIDAGGTINLPTNATVTGPLTIVSSGKVALGRTLSASGGPWPVVIVAQSTAANAIDVPSTFVSASGVHLLLFSNGTIDIRNQVTMTGAVYGDTVKINNQFNITQSNVIKQLKPPGFKFNLHSSEVEAVVPVQWREVAPGPPPS